MIKIKKIIINLKKNLELNLCLLRLASSMKNCAKCPFARIASLKKYKDTH